ncbi:PAP2 superfamily-domain-containing protein [Infundibulicybe gibba]|nr:PAP2 superfamily-domain-containing protein [Infundibulicybe gibba]
MYSDHKAGRNSGVRFTLSVPPSASSSRSASPAPSLKSTDQSTYQDDLDEKRSGQLYLKGSHNGEESPGYLPMDVYDVTLPWWRAAIRRHLVKAVARESIVLAKMQEKIRTPWLDAYFVYTSSLGTHTFFMTVLPAFFFFGYEEVGRGLLVVLALGVYCASFVKDLICSPRPFAPPVTRLTMGSHHLEYGFPSTHSTNSVSIALLLFSYVHSLATTPSTVSDSSPGDPIISPMTFTILSSILAWYTFSIVFGRLYTAMHSFTDCVMGVAMGAGIWWGHSSWSGIPVALSASNPISWLCSFFGLGTKGAVGSRIVYLGRGFGAGQWVEDWVARGGWEVPLILIPLCLLAVNQHPQPVDDCPCFEDAIAFASVVLGALVGRWAMGYAGIGLGVGRTVVMPGSGWMYQLGQWVQVERELGDVVMWWGVASLKMVVGILVIFIWRLVAKSLLHLILPPTFRLLSRAFKLPNRRFYTPATDYKNVPSDFAASGPGGGFGLHPIPSVIDLPGTGGVGVEIGGIGSGVDAPDLRGRDIKMRGGGSGLNGKTTHGNGHSPLAEYPERETGKDEVTVKHYDADVLTKVIVYAGIAVLACEVLPLMFEIVGWGVRSWVV